jgi:phosphotransferase system enzyme I (PtsI)
MLEDKSLMAEIISIIRNHGANAEWAVRQATDRIRNAYQSLNDEYFRERVSDIENVVERILLNLSGDKPFSWTTLPNDLIVVGHDFNPSIFAIMDLQKVRALGLESGGRTSHTAIIARSLRPCRQTPSCRMKCWRQENAVRKELACSDRNSYFSPIPRDFPA